jgi:CRP-like cAMP-binding protein
LIRINNLAKFLRLGCGAFQFNRVRQAVKMSKNTRSTQRSLPGGGPYFVSPALWSSGESPDHLLTAEDRTALALMATVVRFRRGERIYREGDNAESVFNVVAGMADSYKLLPDGRKHIVGFLFPNDLFGLAQSGRYVNSVEASTAVTLYKIPASAVQARLQRHAGLGFPAICKLCDDLREAQGHAFLLSKHRAAAKLGLFLQLVESHQAHQGLGADEIFLPMTRTAIGFYAGISLEAVSRSLRELTDRGMISFRDRRHLRIVDRPRLEAAIAETNAVAAQM